MRIALLALLLAGCGADKIDDICTKARPCYAPGPFGGTFGTHAPGKPDAGADGADGPVDDT